jgi:phage I-like protein
MTKRNNTLPSTLAFAACSTLVTASTEVQLFPAGGFRARDGRPVGLQHWYIDGAIAANLVEAAAARINPYVIDYDHQTLRAQQNGKPAPAAGWFKALEWREGAGLFATGVDWTAAASSGIEGKEYLYISPVFSFDKKTGAVTALYMAALTNDAAIDGMDQVLAAASSLFDTPPATPSPEEISMEALLEQLRWLLNLPVGATAEDVTAQLGKLIDTIKTGQGDAAAAASFDLIAHLTSQGQEIAALSNAVPDPAKWVSVDVMNDLRGQLVALNTKVGTSELDQLITGALASGKLLPAQEKWARDLGAKDIAALSTYIDTTPALGALQQMQTGGAPPPGDGVVALTQAQKDMCFATGLAEDQFLATLKAERTA